MASPTLDEKIRGSLIGAAIGSELDFSRHANPDQFRVEKPMDVLGLKLKPASGYKEERGRVSLAKSTPFIDLGIRVYLKKHGRVTPEDFAAELKDDPDISQGVFYWDGVHTVQELLKEGMNPRISGMGNAPLGVMVASMLGVGIYHFADPEYAYVDGVELASVVQPKSGADWAALTAAAIAHAFDPAATPESVVNAVLGLAHRSDKDTFYLMDRTCRDGGWLFDLSSQEAFVNWWYNTATRLEHTSDKGWYAYNPLSFVLPLLKYYADEPEKLMALLLAPPWGNPVPMCGMVGGAIIGALYGPVVFPDEWLKWGKPIAKPWFAITNVVAKRLDEERIIIREIERVADTGPDGESILFQKIHGCVLAGAIGNAMGSPVEGSFYWEIDEKYPGGIKTILNPRCLETEDDNQMAMLLMETYLERGGHPVMARHFGKTWLERLNRYHFYANCMGNAYDLLRKGWDPRITGHWSVVTGSTAMCMEPVGLFHIADPKNAYIDATAISYMYQRGRDVVAAAILAAAVSEALRADATVDSVCHAALDAAPREKVINFDAREFDSVYNYLSGCFEVADKYDDVLAARSELYEKCMLYHAIEPWEFLGFSLSMFKIANGDVRQAAIGGTNIGRDADTNAGRAAMLAGTLSGAGNIPKEWIAMFKPEALDKIHHNCARMTELVTSRMQGSFSLRQSLASINKSGASGA